METLNAKMSRFGMPDPSGIPVATGNWALSAALSLAFLFFGVPSIFLTAAGSSMIAVALLLFLNSSVSLWTDDDKVPFPFLVTKGLLLSASAVLLFVFVLPVMAAQSGAGWTVLWAVFAVCLLFNGGCLLDEVFLFPLRARRAARKAEAARWLSELREALAATGK